MAELVNLDGQTFGRWSVLEQDLQRKGKGAFWRCVCSCGTQKSVSSWALRIRRIHYHLCREVSNV